MKKRFLSLVLTLSLVVSLGVPALAAEEAGETGIKDWYTFLGEYIAGSPIPEDFDDEAWYLEYEAWDYDDASKEEYMEWMELSEEEFRQDMWVSYVWEMEPPIYDEAEAAYSEYVVEHYRTAHPGELEALTQEQLLAWLGYTETLTPAQQYMEDYGWADEDEILPNLLWDYVTDRNRVAETHEKFLTYQAQYPDQWDFFDADDFFKGEYAWDGYTKEEYTAYYHLFTEEEFAEQMFTEYVDYYRWEWDYKENNWYWDGQDYDRVITLWANGEPIDTDVTAADGVTYADPAVLNEILGTGLSGDQPVSIRSAAEDAGWDIAWNSYRRQVVLLDRERLCRGVVIDGPIFNEDGEAEYLDLLEYDLSQFEELLRRLLSAAEVEEGQSYRTTGTYDLDFTAFNSLDGDKTCTLTLKTDVLIRDNVMDVTLTANAAQLLELLSQNTKDALAAELPKVTFQNLKTLLTGCKLQLLLDLEEGEIYWNTPLLTLVDETAGEEDWYHLSLPDWDLGTVADALEAFQNGEVGIGDALYAWLLDSSESGWGGAADSYSDFFQLYVALNTFCGPHTMTEKNGTLTWSLDKDLINWYLNDAMYSALYYIDEGDLSDVSLFKEYDLSVSVDRAGTVTTSVAVRPDMDALAGMLSRSEWYGPMETALMTWALNLFDFRETAHSTATANHGTGTAEFHWKNQFKLEIATEMNRKEVKEAPRTTPPAGAVVVELN